MLDNFREIYDKKLNRCESSLENYILDSIEVRMFVYEVCKACVSQQADEADVEYEYAKELTLSIAKEHYPESPELEPLPDLMGVLTQIDNMTTGLIRNPDEIESDEEERERHYLESDPRLDGETT